MSKRDPAISHSNFERHDLDRYWTEPGVTKALIQRIPAGVKRVWEPAAGRGDMAAFIHGAGYEVVLSDLDPSEVYPNFAENGIPVEKGDFLTDVPTFFDNRIDAIITNPPFGDTADKFVRRALSFPCVRVVMMVLRSEWNHGKSRYDLFTAPEYGFREEVVLTWRPRWDWWMTPEEKRAAKIAAGLDPDKPDSSPRHNFSIFIWDKTWSNPPTQTFALRPKKTKVKHENTGEAVA